MWGFFRYRHHSLDRSEFQSNFKRLRIRLTVPLPLFVTEVHAKPLKRHAFSALSNEQSENIRWYRHQTVTKNNEKSGRAPA
jgi:hypothetical protein